jgi:hypothetical protein
VLLSVFVQLASGPDVGAFWLGPALVSGVRHAVRVSLVGVIKGVSL